MMAWRRKRGKGAEHGKEAQKKRGKAQKKRRKTIKSRRTKTQKVAENTQKKLQKESKPKHVPGRRSPPAYDYHSESTVLFNRLVVT